MLRVGLTGGIACGKSRVLRRLAAQGFRTVDLDRVAHELMARGGPAHAGVVAAFGESILDAAGEIDRRALAAVVFADGEARERLNGIVHPLVRREEARRLESLAPEAGGVAVTDAALLVESGYHLRFERLVVVHCEAGQQLSRLVARDGLSRADAEARIAAQMPIADKRRFAHLSLDSSGRPEDTDRAADALAARLRAEAARPDPPELVVVGRLHEMLERTGADGSTALLCDDMVAAGGLEMTRVAALFPGPRRAGWWALAAEPAPGLERLLAPVVAWSLARRGGDDALLGLAVYSLARALTADPALAAAACASALRLARPTAGAAEAGAFGHRWGGVLPAPRGAPQPPSSEQAKRAAERLLAALAAGPAS